MVKVGLLSDTHGWLDPKIVEFFKDCNEVWHCGDIGDVAITDALAKRFTLHAVYGNIDGVYYAGYSRKKRCFIARTWKWSSLISEVTRGIMTGRSRRRYGGNARNFSCAVTRISQKWSMIRHWDACISIRGQPGNSGSTRYGLRPVSRLTGNGLKTLNWSSWKNK